VSAISDLLTQYQHVIADLRIVMGSKGVFDVVVDGTTIYSKHETGRHADPGEVLELFTEHLGADVPRYQDQ
jgi:selenoprotein W-related protein